MGATQSVELSIQIHLGGHTKDTATAAMMKLNTLAAEITDIVTLRTNATDEKTWKEHI